MNKIKKTLSIQSTQSTSQWNEAFFKSFRELRTRLFSSWGKTDLESLAGLQLDLTNEYFQKNILWEAILILKNGQADQVTGRVILFKDKNLPYAHWGYFEADNDPSVFLRIEEEIRRFSQIHQVNQWRGPINGHFFFSYRFKTKGEEGEEFYNDPQNPPYYVENFRDMGWDILNTWETFEITNLDKIIDRNNAILGRLKKYQRPKGKELTRRMLTPFNWDQGLQDIHHIFHETFLEMGDFCFIDFPTFKAKYDGYKVLANPFLNYIFYEGNRPVGFSLSTADPSHLIAWYLTFREKRFVPSFLAAALFYIRQIINRERLLLLYVGVTKDQKMGFQAILGKYLTGVVKMFRYKRLYYCFQEVSMNKNRAGFYQNYKRPSSEYILLGKTFEHGQEHDHEHDEF